MAMYTAGEEISSLIPQLEHLVEKYEIRQAALALSEQSPEVSPLAIDDLPHEYEECVQIIGLCILLHRTDLLKRFVKLIDNAGYAGYAGYAGDDTLYEDLLHKILPSRTDVDQWYHDVYSPLVQAIYTKTKEEATSFLKKHCSQWYPAFKQAPWHDTHLQGEEGNYVGYWAFEAGAIAFLYGIDDSKIDHGLSKRPRRIRQKLSSNKWITGRSCRCRPTMHQDWLLVHFCKSRIPPLLQSRRHHA